MLKKLRVLLASVSLVLLTLAFLDFTGTIHKFMLWIIKIQFVPAVLALNVVAIVAIVLLTLLFGRVYCSVLCPLGVMQDASNNLSSRRSKKLKFRFKYSKACSYARFGVLALFIAAAVAGIGSIIAVLEPYSAFGRIVSTLLAPIWQWGNNILAYFAERADSYAFYTEEVWLKSVGGLVLAIATFAVVGIWSWKKGRAYCNTICPVGTVLGYLSKLSLLKPRFDEAKCTKCGLCEKGCKSSCIDAQSMTIDSSRCVTCFNCIENCKFGAMSYSAKCKKAQSAEPKASDSSRRAFMTTSMIFATTAAVQAQKIKVDGGLSVIVDKKVPKRTAHITPPGSKSARNFASKCTGCQLCVTVCPNMVLRPSSDIMRFMQPELSFERGFCRPECNKCSKVCPSGAIQRISHADKTATSIGTAVWIEKNCLSADGEIVCNACERRCPSGAIQMVSYKGGSIKVPAIDPERCTGCGGCEYVCPSNPYSAIYVEGSNRHRTI